MESVPVIRIQKLLTQRKGNQYIFKSFLIWYHILTNQSKKKVHIQKLQLQPHTFLAYLWHYHVSILFLLYLHTNFIKNNFRNNSENSLLLHTHTHTYIFTKTLTHTQNLLIVKIMVHFLCVHLCVCVCVRVCLWWYQKMLHLL